MQLGRNEQRQKNYWSKNEESERESVRECNIGIFQRAWEREGGESEWDSKLERERERQTQCDKARKDNRDNSTEKEAVEGTEIANGNDSRKQRQWQTISEWEREREKSKRPCDLRAWRRISNVDI